MRSLLKLLLLTSAAATQAAAPNFPFIFTDDQGWSWGWAPRRFIRSS
ncbi:MAG: hypothetical protein ACK467_04810 [Opitutia bacterium]|jgi:hypothetical protein